MKHNKTGWLLAGIVTLSATAGVFAHGGATGIVKDRMDGMSAMAEVVKTISDMFRAGQSDPAIIRDGAATIQQHAGDRLLALFPEGSDGEPSEAKAEIWTDWEAFSVLAENLSVLAAALEQAADNPPSDGTMGGGMMGGGMMGTDSSMMGAGMMGDAAPLDADALAQMPVQGVFNMIVQTCSSCHTRFRIEN